MKDRDKANPVAEEVELPTGVRGNYTGNIPTNPAFCIPALNLMDGPAGTHGGTVGTTAQLPAPVAAASTWNTAEEKQYGPETDRGRGSPMNCRT